MSRTDRTLARARKAFCHYSAEAAEAKADKASARVLRRALRADRHARAEYLDSLRLADLLEA